MRKIGHFNATRYWQKYVFGNAPEGYAYSRAIDIPFHLTKTTNQVLLNTKWLVPFQNLDLVHTYNSIIPYNKPWVIEVESFAPRYGALKEGDFWFDWGVKRLQSNSCKQIIFTSEFTKKMNQPNFTKWGIDSSKTQVIYRAVERYPSLVTDDDSFRILFAGNGFFRKGGMELLKAFKNIKNAQLDIISSFEIDWEIIPTEEEKQWVNAEINNNPNITVYGGLPHNKVIEMMQKSHVFVATTFADPFNNTILEAMACGVPIISSDIRSIPEFVKDGTNGFSTAVDKQNKDHIVDFITKKITLLQNNKSLRQEMGAESLRIATELFSIETRKKRIKEVYDHALKN